MSKKDDREPTMEGAMPSAILSYLSNRPFEPWNEDVLKRFREALAKRQEAGRTGGVNEDRFPEDSTR
jgi:hypothetical protein